MTWIPRLGDRVRSLHSSAIGTVDKVYRARADAHCLVDVELDCDVTVTSFLADFMHTYSPVVDNVVRFDDYRERRVLRAMVASLSEGPSCA
jgi:hypothetical protein